MNFTEYQSLARRTQNRRLTPDEELRHALCGLPAEVGEICGHFQKVYQGHPLIVEKVAEEMGDALWFLGERPTSSASPWTTSPVKTSRS